ncbi:MAG: ABC transporter permease [Clostridiales bacterium]|nr:ABC transporter permease [Clostridiales bacterium]
MMDVPANQGLPFDPAEVGIFERIKLADEEKNKVVRPSLTYWQSAWLKLRKNRVAATGLIIIIIYVLTAIIAPIASPYSFSANDAKSLNQPPSAQHWFGTDTAGRDMWTRTWMGARVSLAIGLAVVAINMLIGATLGGIAGYFGGRVDMVIMRIIDILYAIPVIIIAILLMTVLGKGILPLIAAMVAVGWVGNVRLVRGQVLQLKNSEFVLAAKTLGAGHSRIILRHFFPNINGIIITQMTMAIPLAIFLEAFLSYIGLGVQAPGCSWGSLAKAATDVYRIYPYQLLIPAFFICTTMLSLNLLGDGLRDALDPKMHGKY